MYPKQALAAAGSVLLLVGVFAPVVSMPLGGPITYYGHARFDAIAIMALAALSCALALAQQFKALWLTGLASAGVLAYSLTHVQQRIVGIDRHAGGVFGDALRALSDMTMDSVRYEWGWAPLVAGAALVLLAAALRPARA